MQQRRRVHEALAATLDADPDRRVWHRAALMSGTHEELARELEEAGARARRRGAIDVAVTALRRAVQLSAPSHRARRMFATAELAYERGRPDIAVPMLREIERLDLEPLEVARARYLSELMDARALADHSRVAGLIAIAEQAGAAGDRELHHNLLWIAAARTWWANPSPDIRQLIVDAADRAGPPAAADPRLVSIHAYADPYANASKVLDCLRDAADGGVTGAEPRGVPGFGRNRRGRLLRQPDVLRHRDRQCPGRRAPRCPAPPAGEAGDHGGSPARLGHRDPRRRGGPPAGDRTRPARSGSPLPRRRSR